MRRAAIKGVVFCALLAACGSGGEGAKDAGPSDLSAIADLAPARDLQPGASTGATCADNSQCGGQTPGCILQENNGTVWQDGYCTSICHTGENDSSTMQNTDCPGSSTCVGSGRLGTCRALCTAKSGAAPCRDGYICITDSGMPVCEPASYSTCDPSAPRSCPQDGGLPVDGGGFGGEVCARRAGLDPAGNCHDRCDPFAQDCGSNRSCHALYTDGEGGCFGNGVPGKDGAPCTYINDCDPGLACYFTNGKGACRAYCGGPGNVACTNGKKCVDLSGTVKANVLGACAG